MLEVEGPHLTGPGGLEPVATLGTDPAPLHIPLRALETLPPPQPPGALLVHHHALGTDDGVRLAPAPPRMLLAELPQPGPEPLTEVAGCRPGQPPGGTMLPDHPAGPAFGNPEQRRRAGPQPAGVVQGSAVSPRQLLKHVDIQDPIGNDLLQTLVLLLQLP